MEGIGLRHLPQGPKRGVTEVAVAAYFSLTAAALPFLRR